MALVVGLGGLAGRQVKATVRLRRRDEPRTTSAEKGIIEPGTVLGVVNMVKGTPVSGNDDWCQLADGFCWSGGVKPI
jgi:hypothetical protein